MKQDVVDLTFPDGTVESYEILAELKKNGQDYMIMQEMRTKKIFIKSRCRKPDGSWFYEEVLKPAFDDILLEYRMRPDNIFNNIVKRGKCNINPALPAGKGLNRIYALLLSPSRALTTQVVDVNSDVIDISNYSYMTFCSKMFAPIGVQGIIPVEIRIFNEYGGLTDSRSLTINTNAAESVFMITLELTSDKGMLAPGNYTVFMSVNGSAYARQDFGIVYGRNYIAGAPAKQPIRPPEIGVGKGGKPVTGLRKAGYCFMAYTAADSLMITVMAVLCRMLGLIASPLVLLFGLCALTCFLLIIWRYLKKIPYERRKPALAGFLIYGFLLQAIVLCGICLLIPLAISIFSGLTSHREIIEIDGVIYYVER